MAENGWTMWNQHFVMGHATYGCWWHLTICQLDTLLPPKKKIIERTKTQNVEQITISLSIRISRYRADLFENVVAGKNCVLLQAAPVRLVDWMTAEMEVISFRFVYNAYKAAYNFLGLPICRQRLSLATEIWDKFRIEHAKNHFFFLVFVKNAIWKWVCEFFVLGFVVIACSVYRMF